MSSPSPDVGQAIALIQAAYAPPASATPAAMEAVQSLQQQLLALQRTPAAWSLILPLLAFPGDTNVQFFGAHTAHAKIARGELDSISPEEQIGLRDALLVASAVPGRPRVVRRKLYAALGALALRLGPGNGASEGRWPGWVQGTAEVLVRAGEPSAHVHEFLAGAAEDVGGANLLPQARIEMTESLRAASPLVLQSIGTVLASHNESRDPAALPAALTCLTAWLPTGVLPAQDVARLVPPLVALLPLPGNVIDSTKYDAAAATLSELLARPPAGWGARVLLEPLFVWAARAFAFASPSSPPLQEDDNESADRCYSPHAPPPAAARVLRGSAKLLVALGEAGVEWVAGSVVDPTRVVADESFGSGFGGGFGAAMNDQSQGQHGPTRGFLARHFLRVMLALTAVDRGGARIPPGPSSPGRHTSAGQTLVSELDDALGADGIDAADDADDEYADEEADGDASAGASLGFWYLLQEALWEIPVANAYLYDALHPSPSLPHLHSRPTFRSFPSSSSGFGFPATPPPPEPDYSSMTDAEMGRGRGGVGGTPWTPGVGPAGPGTSGAAGERAQSSPTPGGGEDDEGDAAGKTAESPAHRARAAHAAAAYAALVRILRAKVVWPPRRARGGGRDREWGEKFGVYRRDVGDTLVNAYYVLRDDLLAFYVADVQARIEAGRSWEDIEATLHCLRAIHEALDTDSAGASPALARLFGPPVFGRLPAGYGGEWHRSRGPEGEKEKEKQGEAEAIARVRRTALGLVDTYATYFTTQPPTALGGALSYVLGALTDAEPGVCLQAALALRSLCDANRHALAGQIGAFGEVHAGIGGVPDSEKAKVLQSIASVIQALPPAEGIAPVEALVGPVLQRLGEALGAAGSHPEAARQAAILQLEMLTGIAKGLTHATDALAFDDEDGGGVEGALVRAAREDARAVAVREALFQAIARVAELWSADAEVGQALSELCRAITALPADVTLLSLPAQPLLGVVCRAAGRKLTAVWLALASILIAQLNPPPMILTLQEAPSPEVEACVRNAVGEIVAAVLNVLGAPGGMVENPDIVQEFFGCLDRVAQDFTGAFCSLPAGAFDALMQCAISALALQERYSLVAACTFLGTLIHRTALYAPISPELLQQLQAHMIRTHGRAIMRALLCGFAGAAPRSVTSNLLELLGAIVGRWDERVVNEAEGRTAQGGGGARGWVPAVVFASDFYPSKAGQEAKERFAKTVVSSRSVKKTKEAANQFMMVAWGLEGSTFGYSSVSSV